MIDSRLIEKYNVACPRYTSYPTVPYWTESPAENSWFQLLEKKIEGTEKPKMSLYIHLPFCESLCTYCGCNTRITVNHAVELPYIDALLKEWEMYKPYLEKVEIEELHLGGGTPTFFSATNLTKLLNGILSTIKKSKSFSFSFEAHPANTTFGHLYQLKELGFDRLSLGIQDFNLTVQKAINRVQTFEEVKSVVDQARSLGFKSINFDIIYGLPFQTLEAVEDTIEKVKKLMPERIAFYSYAHVPWKHKAQRRYSEEDLPDNDYKRSLYELGREKLEEAGYLVIGMDHFALSEDDLAKSYLSKKMHRNFMGYTPNRSDVLIGLGVSSISDIGLAMMQNSKVVESYKEQIIEGKLPVENGHVLNDADLVVREHVLDLMCLLETDIPDNFPINQTDIKSHLQEMINDGLVHLEDNKLLVNEKGAPFVRNAALGIDERYWSASPKKNTFSKSV